MGVWAQPLPGPAGDSHEANYFGGGSAGAPPPPPAVSVQSPVVEASVLPAMSESGAPTARRATDPGAQGAPRLRHRRQNGVVLTSPPVIAVSSPRSPMSTASAPQTVRRPASAREPRMAPTSVDSSVDRPYSSRSDKPRPQLLDSVHNREPDIFDMRAEPLSSDPMRQPVAETYTDGQVVAAKRIIAAQRKKGGPRHHPPRSPSQPGLGARPNTVAWSEQLQVSDLSASASPLPWASPSPVASLSRPPPHSLLALALTSPSPSPRPRLALAPALALTSPSPSPRAHPHPRTGGALGNGRVDARRAAEAERGARRAAARAS